MPLRELTINTVFKGHNSTQYFTVDGGYDSSIGIDPDFNVGTRPKTSGVLVPSRFENFSGSHINGAPMYILTNPKDTNTYVYTDAGDIARYDSNLENEADITSPTAGAGNGAAYYNNYLYFATPTDVARYGPMDGTPTLQQNAWTSAILGDQDALGNANYPTIRGVRIPNHPMNFHGDNQLYFGDVVEGQGVIHAIKTTEDSVEGDTDDGSAYNVLDLPSGWWPTDIETWGTWLAIAAIQTTDDEVNQGQSAMFLWDALDEDTFQKGPILLPDPLVTAIKNINGILYIWSGNAQNGVRVSRYLGGESVEEIAYIEEGVPPFSGAVDALGNRLNWGGFTTYPQNSASVLAYGSKRADLPKGIHNVAKSTSADTSNQNVTAVKYVQQASNIRPRVIMGWNDDTANGMDKLSETATYDSIWRSEVLNVGKTFEIKEIRIPFGAELASGMELTVRVYTDDDSIVSEFGVINTTNYPDAKRHVSFMQPGHEASRGENNFLIELEWGGTVELPVLLPIRVLIDIDDED